MKLPLTDQLESQKVLSYIFKLPEWYELHNVSHCSLASHGAQAPIVPIQELHGSEICIPDSDDDDGHGQTGGVDNGVTSLVHVRDDSISDDEENKVLLWRRRNGTDGRSV